MRKYLIPAGFATTLTFAAVVWSFETRDAAPGEAMSAAGAKFVSALEPAQKQKAVLAYDSPQRAGWHFVPMESRKGLPLKEMTEPQRKAAHALLRSALSEAGYDKSTAIMSLENLLNALEGPKRRWPRDEMLYYWTVFGDPSGAGRWGLSVEGHHLSLNFVAERGRIVASTPQFMGANPAEVRTAAAGFEKGFRVLKSEEVLAFDLLAALDGDRKAKAVVDKEIPKEIRGAGDAQPPTEPATGLAASEMDEAQQAMLKQLVSVYVSAVPAAVGQERLTAIERAGFENVRFAWLGAEKPGIGHGYRVQGPTFLVEFVNSQPDAEGNPANHIHSVWRDLGGDFGIAAK